MESLPVAPFMHLACPTLQQLQICNVLLEDSPPARTTDVNKRDRSYTSYLYAGCCSAKERNRVPLPRLLLLTTQEISTKRIALDHFDRRPGYWTA